MALDATFGYSSDDCIKCGKCIPKCPIYKINRDESTSPRGFLELINSYENGDLELDYNLKNIFESCFLCTSCVEVCPKSIPVDFAIEKIRSKIKEIYKLSLLKRSFFFLLRHRAFMNLAVKLGYTFNTCLFSKMNKYSMKSRFSFSFLKKNRVFPRPKLISFLSKYPENIAGVDSKKDNKVAIFIGCLANYFYTSVGDSLVNVLKRVGISILIPKKQLCCGAIVYFSGDFKSFDYLIKKNIEYFEKWIDEVEYILIPEATCSSVIKRDWIHFLQNQPKWQKRAKKIIDKIILPTQWLHQRADIKDILQNKEQTKSHTITYHDACHAKKVQGIYDEPREMLLKSGFKIKEMEDSNLCCGFGGFSMQIEKHNLAVKAGTPKANMINNTKANMVSAECSACCMQITNSLNLINSDIKFKNPIELIDEALDVKD